MIITKNITKRQAVKLASKHNKPFENKTIYDSARNIGSPGITRFHEVFHFNDLRTFIR